MNRLPFILLIFLLSACASAQNTPVIVPTATSVVVKKTPTPRPSSTPEATRTPDPMANAPDGADGYETVDGKVVFFKLGVDGKTHNYDTGFKTPESEIIWASSHIKNPTFKGGIPSVDEPGYGLQPAIPINIQVKLGIQAPYIEHISNPDYTGGQTYSMNAHRVLRLRMGITDQLKFNLEIFPDKFEIQLTDKQGNPHTIYGDTSFKIILVDPADIPNPDFQVPKKNPNILSFTIFDDKAHTVTILVANTKPIDQLSDEEFMNTLLYQYGHILVFSDLSQDVWWADPGKASVATSFATMSRKGSPKYFELSPSP